MSRRPSKHWPRFKPGSIMKMPPKPKPGALEAAHEAQKPLEMEEDDGHISEPR